jgi:hypothetical protein
LETPQGQRVHGVFGRTSGKKGIAFYIPEDLFAEADKATGFTTFVLSSQSLTEKWVYQDPTGERRSLAVAKAIIVGKKRINSRASFVSDEIPYAPVVAVAATRQPKSRKVRAATHPAA